MAQIMMSIGSVFPPTTSGNGNWNTSCWINPLRYRHRLSILSIDNKPASIFFVVARLPPRFSVARAWSPQVRIRFRKTQNWWERGLQPNMEHVRGAQHLVDSLLNAGDKLVVVNFFSPGCGGCKALHPKICQLAEMNPDVQFLLLNYDEHKSMCYTLHVHVLPFFRFYRGAHGRLCSFSCTNATIKKFKDALAKYNVDCCSIGPTKGLEEKELLALSASRDLSFSYHLTASSPQANPAQKELLTESLEAQPHLHSGLPLPLPHPISSTVSSTASQTNQNSSLVAY